VLPRKEWTELTTTRRHSPLYREPAVFIRAPVDMSTCFGFDRWSPVFDVLNSKAEAVGQALVWHKGL
jgi:hypothetical protein